MPMISEAIVLPSLKARLCFAFYEPLNLCCDLLIENPVFFKLFCEDDMSVYTARCPYNSPVDYNIEYSSAVTMELHKPEL